MSAMTTQNRDASIVKLEKKDPETFAVITHPVQDLVKQIRDMGFSGKIKGVLNGKESVISWGPDPNH